MFAARSETAKMNNSWRVIIFPPPTEAPHHARKGTHDRSHLLCRVLSSNCGLRMISLQCSRLAVLYCILLTEPPLGPPPATAQLWLELLLSTASGRYLLGRDSATVPCIQGVVFVLIELANMGLPSSFSGIVTKPRYDWLPEYHPPPPVGRLDRPSYPVWSRWHSGRRLRETLISQGTTP